MTKIIKQYVCDCCGRDITHGDNEAFVDSDGNIFCDEDCAMHFHHIDNICWDFRDMYDDDGECRANLFGCYYARDGIVTNGKYLILGADKDLVIDSYPVSKRPVSDKDLDRFREMARRRNVSDDIVSTRLSLLGTDDNTDGHIKHSPMTMLITICGHWFQKQYIEFCAEIIGYEKDSVITFAYHEDVGCISMVNDNKSAFIMNTDNHYEDEE